MSNLLPSLLGKYHISDQSHWSSLLDDAGNIQGCMLSQLRDIALAVSEDDGGLDIKSLGSQLFGVLYLAELSQNLLDEGHSRALKSD
ncbi:MAG: hypothetical protein K6L73_12045 [Cellvibrionaceae bacterium]